MDPTWRAADAENRVIVCGGRDFDDRTSVMRALALSADTIIVHGAQSGADTLAAEVWESWGGKTEPHPANVKKYGSPAAFHIRNQEIADAGARLCIAFPGGSGTANMIERAEKAGIPIRKIGKRIPYDKGFAVQDEWGEMCADDELEPDEDDE